MWNLEKKSLFQTEAFPWHWLHFVPHPIGKLVWGWIEGVSCQKTLTPQCPKFWQHSRVVKSTLSGYTVLVVVVAQLERLSEEAIAHLADETNEVWFSVASVWEMGIKAAIKKLPLPESIDSYISSRMVQLRARSLFNFSNSCFTSGCIALASSRSF